MSKNIKEIGKELLGKSLNSFHKKTGLPQLERNNEMQDGILNGILSQVDDAYIEKTEQSNIIYLEGSGDGVVVLDSIEGNTMVNIGNNVNPPMSTNQSQFESMEIIDKGDYVQYKFINALSVDIIPKTDWSYKLNVDLVAGKTYTVILPSMPLAQHNRNFLLRDSFNPVNYSSPNRVTKWSFTATKNGNGQYAFYAYSTNNYNLGDTIIFNMPKKVIILEGDYTNKEINHFTGLQSSFEEKVNDDGKYEIEILMKNKNLIDVFQSVDENVKGIQSHMEDGILNLNGTSTGQADFNYTPFSHEIHLLKGKKYRLNFEILSGENSYNLYCRCAYKVTKRDGTIQWLGGTIEYLLTSYIINGDEVEKVSRVRMHSSIEGAIFNNFKVRCQLEISDTPTTYEKPKQNKIKLLINEPLRSVGNIKDRLVSKNNKLMVERNCGKIIFDGTYNIWHRQSSLDNETKERYCTSKIENVKLFETVLCNTLPSTKVGNQEITNIYIHNTESRFDIQKLKTDNRWTDVNGLNNWFRNNPTKVVYPLAEPIYEEVLNEYGEPILLEGYENGTIYIDSTIVPNTTIRYTPKMESFKTLNEVSNNNTMLANDINENIIPYMMDVDYMIMEKELCLLNTKNIRKMEVLDMTSMQKRTQEMLERLIKGKTLTEQECKTRVTTYLNAGKITDEQAEELMLVISEIYN